MHGGVAKQSNEVEDTQSYEVKVKPDKKLKKKKRRNRGPFDGWKENLAGYLFIGPMFIGTSILVLFPIIASLALSFTDWNFVSGYKNASFIGFENFRVLLSNTLFHKALLNNILL